MNLQRVYAIAARKFASLRRDKRMFGFIVIMPALQILLFGWAIGGTPTDLNVIVVDDGPDENSAIFIGYIGDAFAEPTLQIFVLGRRAFLKFFSRF